MDVDRIAQRLCRAAFSVACEQVMGVLHQHLPVMPPIAEIESVLTSAGWEFDEFLCTANAYIDNNADIPTVVGILNMYWRP